jgi:Flp pilus assembly protein TadD
MGRALSRQAWREPLHRGVSVHVPRSEAEPLLRAALELAERQGAAPEDVRNILHHLGEACAGTDKLAEAELFLRRALALSAGDPQAWATQSALAAVLRRRGDLGGARAIYQLLAAERGSGGLRSATWLSALADVEIEMGEGAAGVQSWEEARAVAELSMRDPIMHAETLARMARAMERAGDRARAIEVLQRAVELVEAVMDGRAISPSARLPAHVLAPIAEELARLRQKS